VPAATSSTLLGLVREALKRRGWNTAALATRMQRDRSALRSILGGQTPLLVDDFFEMVSVLELSPEELGIALPGGAVATGVEPAETPALRIAPVADEAASDAWTIDPDAPQAEQLIRAGFGLGVDMHLVAETAELAGSGIPKEVLAKYPERLPIRLDAAFHVYMRPRYLAEGVELRISFDRVCTCFFPWSSIRQISFYPEAPLPPREDESAGPSTPGRPVLKLVT
jgi:hypothetical protein